MALTLVLAFALLGPPPPTLPEPDAAPIEGPRLPATEPAPTSDPNEQPEPSEGGSIEFAVPPPELSGEPEAGSGIATPTTLPPEPEGEPRRAPAGGGSWIAGGVFLMPFAAYGMAVLLEQNRRAGYSSSVGGPSIIAAGSVMIGIGAAMTGIGINRAVKLRSWARRERVEALPQGSGLLTFGTLSLLGAIPMLLTSPLVTPPFDRVAFGVSIALLAAAPIELGVGGYFLARYRQQGGWRRIQPRMTLGPTYLGLDVRF